MNEHFSRPKGKRARLGLQNPKIVALGGGTGLSNLLRGLKHYSSDITAVVTVADDGGSSGWLRRNLGILPPGDLRSCILALSNIEPVMENLLSYRFNDGSLKGQSFGNLFIAAMSGISESFEEAIRRVGDVLAIRGRVLPVTAENVNLRAYLENGDEAFGESAIPIAGLRAGSPISRVELVPGSAAPCAGVLESIKRADLIILGPGSLYTSIIPNLLVKGVAREIAKARAAKLYICNIMTQPGETDRKTAFDHAEAIIKHGGAIDYCLVNNGPVARRVLSHYQRDGAGMVKIDKKRFAGAGIRLIEADIAETRDDLARHDSDKLALEIMEFLSALARRGKISGFLRGAGLDI